MRSARQGRHASSRVTRRDFIRASAGLAGVLALRRAPAFAQQRELTILSWSHFVPASDKELRRQTEEFARQAGVKVRLDHIAHLQLPAKRAAEAQARSGHDIIQLWTADPDLYFDLLVDVDDLANELDARHGGWLNKTDYMFRSRWKAIPWYVAPFPLVYRVDLLERVGEKVPDTWEDLIRAGKKLKAIGHPVGIQISHCADANIILRGLMWGYGASFVAADSQTITINSPQTATAIEVGKRLYTEAMEQEVLSWDDAGNNRCINGGRCSMIVNPISAYASAKVGKVKIPGSTREIHEVMDHALPPAGPAGRFIGGNPNSLAIWSFSKNVDLAKAFIRFHYGEEQMKRWIGASEGFNVSLLRGFASHPVWTDNPKYQFNLTIGQYMRHHAWPGEPTAPSQTVYDLFIIPDMFAQAVTGRLSTQDAMAWAEKEIQEIYAGRKKKA